MTNVCGKRKFQNLVNANEVANSSLSEEGCSAQQPICEVEKLKDSSCDIVGDGEEISVACYGSGGRQNVEAEENEIRVSNCINVDEGACYCKYKYQRRASDSLRGKESGEGNVVKKHIGDRENYSKLVDEESTLGDAFTQVSTRADNSEELSLLNNDHNFAAGMLNVVGKTADSNETSGRTREGRFRVGPFVVATPVSVDDMKLIDYMMNEALDDCEPLVHTKINWVTRKEMLTLCPKRSIQGEIISVVAEMLTNSERGKVEGNHRSWFMPSYFDQKVLVEGSDVSCLGMGTRFRECYMQEFGLCDKIFKWGFALVLDFGGCKPIMCRDMGSYGN